MEVHGKGGWKVLAKEYTDTLDGTRQMLHHFECRNGQSGGETAPFGTRFRIRSAGALQERHPLWLSMVEFYGVVRVSTSTAFVLRCSGGTTAELELEPWRR